MRILITNNTLAERAGTELYVLDLARSLQDRGHTVIAYSTELGEVAEELRAADILVVNDLSALTVRPDIIHGHHHLDTMAALLCLPGVPAIFVCHGSTPWEEMPPLFPRIFRYVAVDHTCLDRLHGHHIPPEKTQVILNFVDLRRFQSRAPLPTPPQRSLVFSNYAREETYVKIVREACARFDLSVDVAGSSSKTATTTPERLLPQYDLVFAKARSALEAMAVGNAVILCDDAGCGAMVSTDNFDQLRLLNFGMRTLQAPITVENLTKQIARYDPQESAKVSEEVRRQAGLDHATDQLVELYENVIEENRGQPAIDPALEQQATAAYFRLLVPELKKRHVSEERARQAEAQYQHERAQHQHSLAQHQEFLRRHRGVLAAKEFVSRFLKVFRRRKD
jgi:glycosyl transferase family 4